MPGSDDVMLNYQSLSHHDAVFCRETLKRPPAPEFEAWLADGVFAALDGQRARIGRLIAALEA